MTILQLLKETVITQKCGCCVPRACSDTVQVSNYLFVLVIWTR